VLLALLGLVTGLVVHLIIGELSDSQLSAGLLAALAFVTVTAGLIGFTIERRLWWASVAFAVAAGVVAAGIVWWNGAPDHWSGGDGWRGISLLLAIAIAAPLFQAGRDEGGPRFPYASVHDHAWTNVVLWGACWVFVGITFALTYLLAGLFDLIKLRFLSNLLRNDWFWRALIGLAFGGALGILREQTQVVRLLQRVVLTVLSVLAPVLAVGLIVFLVALPFTGLAPLWEAGSATGILLACVVGSLILSNSVIGNAPGEERKFPLPRFAAMGLAAVMLPLGIIAAVAIGLRIGQYGFTPERLWALTFVILACAYGLAYLVSLARGRLDWAAKVRPANLNLAFGTCAVALLLATPLVSFNAIATRDQVSRLESGRLAPEKFDWRALAFEFGEPGKAALKKLQASANADIRERAARAGKAESRWEVQPEGPSRADVARRLRVLPAGSPPLPDALLDYLATQRCGAGENGGCTVLLADAGTAMVLRDSCFAPRDRWPCNNATEVRLIDGNWTDNTGARPVPKKDEAQARADAQRKAYASGQIEMREVKRRQLFVGGEPIGTGLE
jgi:hypothetical protein